MIFIDSNIPMYLVGAAHPHKIDARQKLEQCISEKAVLVTDAEVFQEILHRYIAIERRDAVQPAFETLTAIADVVHGINLEDAVRAKDILLGYTQLSARDALHIAVMERHGVSRILTFDRAFGKYPGIEII